MSLQPIPNQPVGFVATRLQGALCGADPEERLPVADGDNITFQFRFSTCEDEGFIGDPTFIDPTAWRNVGGWVFGDASVCKASGSTSLALQYAGWTPDIGTLYQIEVRVDVLRSSIPGGAASLEWSLGGVSGTLDAPGSYLLTAQAISTGRLTFVASGAEVAVCLTLAQVTILNPDNEIRIVDLEGDTIKTYNYSTDAELYDYSGGYMTINLPATDSWGGCFRIEIDDPCAEATYASQVLSFINPDQTIKIRACNVSEGMGFGRGFTPEARYVAKLARSTFDYEEGVERGTNGYVNNYYVERRRSMSLAVDHGGEFAHDFLSSLPLWDHVYFGQAEYRVKAESYEPEWGDIYEAHGSIIISVEPKQEGLRKVRTMPDVAMGCVPPPNYLVQGTGPNNDYITLNSGGRIRLHE